MKRKKYIPLTPRELKAVEDVRLWGEKYWKQYEELKQAKYLLETEKTARIKAEARVSDIKQAIAIQFGELMVRFK